MADNIPDAIVQDTEPKKAESKKDGPPLTAREEIGEFFRTAVIAVLLAVFIRTFFYEPFNIPSGSMKPTLEIGDYLFVQKPAYGYSRYSFPFGLAPLEGRVWSKVPERGDIIVFKIPSNPHGDPFIKRVIGLPGDTVQVKNGRLYLNEKLVPREPLGLRKDVDEVRGVTTMTEYLETLPNGVMHSIYEEGDDRPHDNTPKYIVPEEHYFMMGDNRDNSQDSRVASVVSFVPFENFVGRADFIFFSTNGFASLFEPWKWPWTVRYNRLFMRIRPNQPAVNSSAQTATVAADAHK
jgi:signal peptidase I